MRDLKAATWTWQVNPCSALYGVPSASNLNKKTNYLLCTYVESCGYYICGVMWVLHMWSHVGTTYVESCEYYICGVMWVLHMLSHVGTTYVESCGYYICGVMWVLRMWSHVGTTYVESCGYYICTHILYI